MLRELRRIIIGYQSATSRMTEKGFPPVDRRDRIDAVATGSGPAKSFYPVIFGDSIHPSYAARAGGRASERASFLLRRSSRNQQLPGFNDVIEEP